MSYYFEINGQNKKYIIKKDIKINNKLYTLKEFASNINLFDDVLYIDNFLNNIYMFKNLSINVSSDLKYYIYQNIDFNKTKYIILKGKKLNLIEILNNVKIDDMGEAYIFNRIYLFKLFYPLERYYFTVSNRLQILLSDLKNKKFSNFYTKNFQSKYLSLNNNNICCILKEQNCSKIDKIKKIAKVSSVGVPSILTLKNGEKVVSKNIINAKPFVNLKKNPIPTNIMNSNSNYWPCFGKTVPMKFFSSDVFTNEYIITNLIYMLFQDLNFPSLSVEPRMAGVCKKDGELIGINTIEYAPLGSLFTALSDSKFLMYFKDFELGIINILKQINTTYLILAEYANFNHSDAKVENCLIFPEPIRFSYKGLNIDSPFTVKIADFDKAGFTKKIGNDNIRFLIQIL